FFALTVATLFYDVIAGEAIDNVRNRAATEELLAGVPFGLAAMMLFHAIAVLMEATGIHGAATAARGAAAVIIPPLTLFYLVNGVGDTETARAMVSNPAAICNGESPIPMIGNVLTMALFALLLVFFFLGTVSKWAEFLQRLELVGPILVGLISI